MVRQPGDGRQEALAEFNQKKEALYEERTPRDPKNDGLTIKELCNRYLTAKQRRMESAELSPRSFYECKQATDLIIGLGSTRLVGDLVPADFESLRANMVKKWGPARLGKFVGLIRSVFKYAVENDLNERPVVFGSEFRKPLKAVLRKQKSSDGKKLFTAVEINQILDGTTVKGKRGIEQEVLGASKQLRAAILLGIDAKIPPWQISFKGTLQTLSHFLPGLASSTPLDTGCRALVARIATHRVGNRPDRFEPRRIKQRPKSQALLQRPRHEYKRLAA